MMASKKIGADILTILKDLPKGERNRSPMKYQVQVEFPSYGLNKSKKKFCVSKKWWNVCPLNSDQKNDQISTYWSNHFKGIHDKKYINF